MFTWENSLSGCISKICICFKYFIHTRIHSHDPYNPIMELFTASDLFTRHVFISFIQKNSFIISIHVRIKISLTISINLFILYWNIFSLYKCSCK